MIQFFIPGVSVPKGRPKFARRGNFVSTYTPAKTKAYESHVRSSAVSQLGIIEPLQGPLCVELTFTLPIPASTPKKRIDGLISQPHTKKPDLDNLAKAVLDSLNGLLWVDDGQIYKLSAVKVYGLEPGVRVTIEPKK